jgi:dTDP-4-dehydrorhamnose 3,5-epimerase-like enzyme
MKLSATRLSIPELVRLEHEAFEDGRGYFMGAADGELMRVAEGGAFLVAVDVSPQFPNPRTMGGESSADDKRQIWSPAGFALRLVRWPTILEFSTCAQRLTMAAASRKTWNDPEIGVSWPMSNPVAFAKDRGAQPFSQWLARVEAKNFSS